MCAIGSAACTESPLATERLVIVPVTGACKILPSVKVTSVAPASTTSPSFTFTLSAVKPLPPLALSEFTLLFPLVTGDVYPSAFHTKKNCSL